MSPDEIREPSEEELRAALEEQMRRIRVEDVLLQTVATLINLAGRRLGLAGTEDEKDLEQARLAIDSARALVPMCPEEEAEPIRQALTQIQMAFAREAQQGAGDSRQSTVAKDETAQSPEDAERARARAKIWTPPGT